MIKKKYWEFPLTLTHCTVTLQTPPRKVPILFSVSALLPGVLEFLEPKLAHV